MVVNDDNFKLIANFDIVVPNGYDHVCATRRLDSFRDINCCKNGEKTEEEIYGKPHYYNNIASRKNFAKVAKKLATGCKLKAKIFQVSSITSLDNCITFLKKQKAMLAGLPGLSLAHMNSYIKEHNWIQLPEKHTLVSFDERDVFWKGSSGYLMVPYVLVSPPGSNTCMLYLDSSEPWDHWQKSSLYILCLCDK